MNRNTRQGFNTEPLSFLDASTTCHLVESSLFAHGDSPCGNNRQWSLSLVDVTEFVELEVY